MRNRLFFEKTKEGRSRCRSANSCQHSTAMFFVVPVKDRLWTLISRTFVFLLLFGISQQRVLAQLSFTNSSPVTETFTGFTGLSTPSNWAIQGTGTGSTTWRGTNQAGGTTGGWYGDQSMSFIGTASITSANATWILHNNTGVTIIGFTFSFKAQMWRNNTSASPTVSVSWANNSSSTNPAQGPLSNTLTSLSFNDATTSINTGTTLSQSVTGLSIASGQYLFFRFIHPGGTNSDNLGWDDVTFTPIFQTTATQLAFVGFPATGTTGNAVDGFTVEARTAGNTVDAFYTGQVTLTKASGNGAVNGTLTANCVAGVATFSSVGFNQAGAYSLSASSGSLTAATSGNIFISNPQTNISANDGVNWVGANQTPAGYSQSINCTYNDYRVMKYRKVSTTIATPTDGRGQWVTTINAQPSGANVFNTNLTGGGGNGFLFTSGGGCGSAGNYDKKWNFDGVGSGAVDAVNGIKYRDQNGGGNDMGLNMSLPGYYTFVLKDAGNTATGFYVGRTAAPPVTITHTSATQQSVAGTGAYIYFTLSGAPSAQEKFYVRYRAGTNDFSTSKNVVEAKQINGTTWRATISGQTAGSTIYYYIFSSTMSLGSIISNTNPDADIAYEALQFSDNNGLNYSYIVPSANTYSWNLAGGGSWLTAGNWSPNGIPGSGDNVTFSNGATATISNVPQASLTRLSVSGNSTITLITASDDTLTLGNPATAFSVAAGSTLNIAGTSSGPITILFSGSGNTATIAGTVNIQGATNQGRYIASNSNTTVTGTLSINGSAALLTSAANNLTIANGGKFQLAGTATAIPTATWNTGSTLEFANTFSSPTTVSFAATPLPYNISVNADMTASGAINLNTSLTTLTIAGNVTVSNTGQGKLNLNNSSGAKTFNISGLYSQSGGTVIMAPASGATTVQVNGSGTSVVSGGSLTLNGASATSSALSLTGNLILSGGTINIQDGYSQPGTGNATMIVTGNFTQTGGTFEFLTAATNENATSTLNVAGNFTRSGVASFMKATGGQAVNGQAAGYINLNGTNQSLSVDADVPTPNNIKYNIGASRKTTLLTDIKASEVEIEPNGTLYCGPYRIFVPIPMAILFAAVILASAVLTASQQQVPQGMCE